MANGAKWFNANEARTINNLALLNQTINAIFLEENYPYLSKTLLEKIADTKPKILIGQDNGILTVAREVVSPRSDGPMMTNTKLGSTRISCWVKERRSENRKHLL
jgi:hypothetical protein